MRSRALLNAGLAVAVAALALFAWLEPGRAPAPERLTLTGVDPDAVGRLRVELRGAPAIELERTAERWAMREPRAIAANGWRVRALLGVLAATSTRGFRAAGNDLAQFGLDPPRARLVADGHAIAFGDTDPIEGRRYVLAGDQVHLVEDAYTRHLEAGAAGLVHPAPLGPDAEPVAIELPGARIVRGDGGWRVAGGGEGAGAAESLAQAWQGAAALWVRPLDPALEWSGTLRVRLRGRAEPVDLGVARTASEIVLARRDLGLQYHFVARSGERLLSLEAHRP